MALALDEEHCGIDAELVYPNVQSCIALAIGTAGGTLAGMHLTVGTNADQVKRAAAALKDRLVGAPTSIVCIGNVNAYRLASGGLIFPGTLRTVLREAFATTCDVDYLDSAALFEATGKGNQHGGVVVRAWRDAQSNRLRYAMGAHTCAVKGAQVPVTVPWFKVSAVKTTDLTGKNGYSYTLNGLSDVPVLGLATM